MMQSILTKIGSDRPLSSKEKQNLILPVRTPRRLTARRLDSAHLLGAGLYVDGSTTDISNQSVEVSGTSVLLNTVKNGDNGKQVRVTAIEVVYKEA